MHMHTVVNSRQMPIKSDYDVVVIRQEVRQVARDLGLGLSQQAKIATAISTIARAARRECRYVDLHAHRRYAAAAGA